MKRGFYFLGNGGSLFNHIHEEMRSTRILTRLEKRSVRSGHLYSVTRLRFYYFLAKCFNLTSKIFILQSTFLTYIYSFFSTDFIPVNSSDFFRNIPNFNRVIRFSEFFSWSFEYGEVNAGKFFEIFLRENSVGKNIVIF